MSRFFRFFVEYSYANLVPRVFSFSDLEATTDFDNREASWDEVHR